MNLDVRIFYFQTKVCKSEAFIEPKLKFQFHVDIRARFSFTFSSITISDRTKCTTELLSSFAIELNLILYKHRFKLRYLPHDAILF